MTDTTTDVETTEAKSLAAIRPDQQRFDDQQVAILRQLGIEDATQGDLDLFFHVCQKTGLDPFRKEVYMIGRNTKVRDQWVTKYTIQVGIDGYRNNGRRTAMRLGDTIGLDGPYWCGEDGEWREVWPVNTPPTAAKYVVTRNGATCSAVVHYEEFVQTTRDGNPNAMWARAPRNQLGKCAEAMAWRRAYPDSFAGVLDVAVQPTVIDQDGNVESEHRPEGRGVGGMRAARERREQQRQQPIDAEIVDEAGTSGPAGPDGNWTPEARRKGLNRMHQLFGKGDLPKDAREDRLLVTSKIVGRTIASSNDLADEEIGHANHELDKLDRTGKLGQFITDVLNEAALAEANAAETATESETSTATPQPEGAK